MTLPAFELFLARADRLPSVDYSSFEAVVFALFGIPEEQDRDLPVAAVTRVLDMGVIDQGWWFRADPVNLHPERDCLILTDSRALSLSQSEADRLVADILDVFADDGWILKAPRPDRWYLKPREVPQIKTTPLPAVVGQDIHPYLPAGKDGKAWHTILYEVQILLHTVDVNAERETRSDPPINSLWFWGGGQLPEMNRHRWKQVWSDEPMSLSLARLSSTPSAPMPESFTEWRGQSGSGDHLVMLDHARTAALYFDAQAWRGWLEAYDQFWMAPVVKALRQGDLDSVTVHTDTGAMFRQTRKTVGRWWRRRQPLRQYQNA